MRARVRNVWENLKVSLWFLPAVMVAGGMILSVLLVRVDHALLARRSSLLPWLFGGTADAAQTLLAVVAGSLVTAVSIAFSTTIVALQLASTQFSPRVLRTTFTADRGNQIVLGSYVATFMYALLVLREIRGSTGDDSGFVPALSVSVALGLSLVCLTLLIYFIHHISQLLQVAVILDRLHADTIEEIEVLYPTRRVHPTDPTAAGELVEHLEETGEEGYIRSRQAGFLRSIDHQTLYDATDGMTSWVWVRPQVGDYVPRDCVMVEFARDGRIDGERLRRLHEAFVLDTERSIYQDPLFGVRQLVDIALKALSPAINDPTTAEYSLSHLGDIVGQLAERSFPPNEQPGPGGRTRYIFTRPNWEAYVDAAFAQIRRQAAADAHVTGYILRVLHQVARRVPNGPRSAAVQHEVDEIRRVLDRGHFSPADTAALRTQCARVESALQGVVTVEL